ncbi:hypothetical protein [Corynebacterium pygosceleis]|uniref:hypothetical protein n=1 Tax=Corynebacterium pygosceleis TaxID=2800406 RepID=UPI002004FDE7|nr:hypothetical protein [Corynebacterium pygosceleis]MCK7675741.1 hypothetical protein [Corynebacterium pygosceleis]
MMVPRSPAEALGSHAHDARELLVDVIRRRHDCAVEAHQASDSRYFIVFGSQWRDLLADVHEAFADRGCRSHKPPPARYNLPVVKDCILYVWRIPGDSDAESDFASSPTRKNVFSAQPPAPTLFESGFGDEFDHEGVSENTDEAKVKRLLSEVVGFMPVVLVMVHSSPRQLQSIEWAVAELDDSGEVKLHGRESIWEPEGNIVPEVSDAESFDHGTPVEPVVEPREQEGIDPDAL